MNFARFNTFCRICYFDNLKAKRLWLCIILIRSDISFAVSIVRDIVDLTCRSFCLGLYWQLFPILLILAQLQLFGWF